MGKKNKKAYQLMKAVPPVKMPHHVMRFFTDPNREIDICGDQASFGEDFGTLKEIRSCLEWFVDQFGGEVKWKEKK